MIGFQEILRNKRGLSASKVTLDLLKFNTMFEWGEKVKGKEIKEMKIKGKKVNREWNDLWIVW